MCWPGNWTPVRWVSALGVCLGTLQILTLGDFCGSELCSTAVDACVASHVDGPISVRRHAVWHSLSSLIHRQLMTTSQEVPQEG